MLEQKASPLLSTRERQRQFEDWFQTPLGRSLLAAERVAIHECIKGFYGYHLLEIPVSHRLPVGNGSLVAHRITAVSGFYQELPESTLVTLPHELPFENDSMDAVILHHALDYAEEARQVVREATRVLVSGGHLVVVGFNPYSLWGIRKIIGRQRQAPWNGRFLSSQRLEDWLTLLDFRVKSRHYDFFQPPVNNPGWIHTLSFLNRWGDKSRLPVGAFYTVVAQKRVAAPIRLKPKWRRIVNVGTMPAVNRVSRELMNEDR